MSGADIVRFEIQHTRARRTAAYKPDAAKFIGRANDPRKEREMVEYQRLEPLLTFIDRNFPKRRAALARSRLCRFSVFRDALSHYLTPPLLNFIFSLFTFHFKWVFVPVLTGNDLSGKPLRADRVQRKSAAICKPSAVTIRRAASGRELLGGSALRDAAHHLPGNDAIDTVPSTAARGVHRNVVAPELDGQPARHDLSCLWPNSSRPDTPIPCPAIEVMLTMRRGRL
jgi:hypothetical protein